MESSRLRRALFLSVTPTGVGEWEVRGGSQPHRVTEDFGRPDCDCPDFRIRGVRCKHQLAVTLAYVPPAILAGLRQLVQGTPELDERIDAWADGQRPLGWESIEVVV